MPLEDGTLRQYRLCRDELCRQQAAGYEDDLWGVFLDGQLLVRGPTAWEAHRRASRIASGKPVVCAFLGRTREQRDQSDNVAQTALAALGMADLKTNGDIFLRLQEDPAEPFPFVAWDGMKVVGRGQTMAEASDEAVRTNDVPFYIFTLCRL